MALHDYCIAAAIRCDLEPSDKEDAIRQMIDALVETNTLTAKKGAAVAKEVIERERQASTGIGNGVGIPHARTAHVDRMILSFGRVPDGFDFAATDGEHVRLIALLLSPTDATDEHLSAMRSIVGIVRDNYQRKRLVGCTTPESFLGLLKELDEVAS